MGFTRTRTGRDGVVRYQALYDDVKGGRRSAGRFATAEKADRAWQRAEERLAEGRLGDARRGRQRFARYVEEEWFPNHEIEARTRENYTYYLSRYLQPTFGSMRMVEILPGDVRQWVADLKRAGASPAVIRSCFAILSAIFTTALNDQVTQLHPCRGVKTPPVPKKLRAIITPEQFDDIYDSLGNDAARLLVEVDIESGLRWGELIEMRPKDIDFATRVLTVRRVALELVPRFHPTGGRFLVKEYPKDREHRRLKLSAEIISKVKRHVSSRDIGDQDLLFPFSDLRSPPCCEASLHQMNSARRNRMLPGAGTRTEPSPRTQWGAATASTAEARTRHTVPNDALSERTTRAIHGERLTQKATSPGGGSASTSGGRRLRPPTSGFTCVRTTSGTRMHRGCWLVAQTFRSSRNVSGTARSRRPRSICTRSRMRTKPPSMLYMRSDRDVGTAESPFRDRLLSGAAHLKSVMDRATTPPV